jgi:peptidoglycan/xylan/chitin deacetylase (PgdA/CDA1 family)
MNNYLIRCLRIIIKCISYLYGMIFYLNCKKGIPILMYHRVVGDVSLDLDVDYENFLQQIKYLSENRTVISYHQAIEELLFGVEDQTEKLAITFDDAFEDFYTHAWPALKALKLPVTLFVPTGYIDNPECSPVIGSPDIEIEKIRPMTWDQLREISDDPLITIGLHTHSHFNIIEQTDEQIEYDLSKSISRFQNEMGYKPDDFAYPKGLWDKKAQKVVKKYFKTAAIVGGTIAKIKNTQVYAIPRLPIRKSDGLFWFNIRIGGFLQLEEVMMRYLKNHIKKR